MDSDLRDCNRQYRLLKKAISEQNLSDKLALLKVIKEKSILVVLMWRKLAHMREIIRRYGNSLILIDIYPEIPNIIDNEFSDREWRKIENGIK